MMPTKTPPSSVSSASFFERLIQMAHCAKRGELPSLVKHRLPWIEALRLFGIQTILQRGLPKKQESWHRLPFPVLRAPVENQAHQPHSAVVSIDVPTVYARGGVLDALPAFPLKNNEGIITSFKHLSLQEEEPMLWCRDVCVPRTKSPAPETTASDGAFPALGMALARDGLLIHLEEQQEAMVRIVDSPGISSAHPLEVGQHLLHMVCLERGARLLLIEEIMEGGGQLSNNTTHVVLKPGASMIHVRVLRSGLSSSSLEREGVGISSALVSLEEGAHYRGVNWLQCERFGRLQSRILLEGEGAKAHVASFLIGRKRMCGSSMVRMYHRCGKTESVQEARGLMAEHSRGLLHGTTHIAPMMTGSQAHQLFRGILLSRDAFLELQPHLDIFHGDVSCTHGAAVSSLDEQSLFYLAQRGFDGASAQKLLCEAFLKEGLAFLAPKTSWKGEERFHIPLWVLLKVLITKASL